MAKYKIGDIFSVNLEDNKKYFQYIGIDKTQLNSDVIRVFKKFYKKNEEIDLHTIVNEEIDFYAHVILNMGIKLMCWKKIGHTNYYNDCKVFFRSSSDYGNSDIKISKKWWIWRINEEQKYIGELKGEYKNAEIGSVVNPYDILTKMKTGNYDFFYPGF